MKLVLGLLLAGLAGVVAAKDPVALNGMKQQGSTATGTCGGAQIKVSGVGEQWVPYDAAVIEINTGGKTTRYSATEGNVVFHDWNHVACAASRQGEVLVLEAVCSGRACNPSDFTLFDMKTGRITTPQTMIDGCDRECVAKALGGPLPVAMQQQD